MRGRILLGVRAVLGAGLACGLAAPAWADSPWWWQDGAAPTDEDEFYRESERPKTRRAPEAAEEPEEIQAGLPLGFFASLRVGYAPTEYDYPTNTPVGGEIGFFHYLATPGRGVRGYLHGGIAYQVGEWENDYAGNAGPGSSGPGVEWSLGSLVGSLGLDLAGASRTDPYIQAGVGIGYEQVKGIDGTPLVLGGPPFASPTRDGSSVVLVLEARLGIQHRFGGFTLGAHISMTWESSRRAIDWLASGGVGLGIDF